MAKLPFNIILIAYIAYILYVTESARKYKVVFERGLITNFNRTLGGDLNFKFIKVNRTSFALNVSFNLYRDMNVDLMRVSGQVYKLTANDYKLYPVSLTIPVCGVTKYDFLIKWSEVLKYTNVPFCGIMKAGNYYVRNYVVHLTTPNLGPIMAGSYKIHFIAAEHNKTLLFEGECFGRIAPIVE